MESHHLISSENVANLPADRGVQSDFFRLRRGQLLSRSSHLLLVVVLAHYRPIERLTRLAEPPSSCNDFVFVASSDLLHLKPLIGSQADGLHQPLLELAFSRRIQSLLPVLAKRAERRPTNISLRWRQILSPRLWIRAGIADLAFD